MCGMKTMNGARSGSAAVTALSSAAKRPLLWEVKLQASLLSKPHVQAQRLCRSQEGGRGCSVFVRWERYGT